MDVDLLPDLAGAIERDLWTDLAAAPPDALLLRDTCALAAQLKISSELTRRDGTHVAQAEAFVVATDDLLHRIEMLGGFSRVGRSALASFYREAAELADALVDAMVAGTA